MSSKLRRVQPGEPITAAAFNALVDAVNRLGQVTAAFPLEVRRTPGGVHVSLAYTEHEALAELTAPLAPGGSATARLLGWDGAAWLPTPAAEISLHDGLVALGGVPGDRVLARFHRQSGRWLVWQPYGWIRRGRLETELDPGGSANCLLFAGPPGGEVESGERLTVHEGLLELDDAPIPSGSRVFVALAHGAWWVIAVACPPSSGVGS
jgi:hypothetical protein